LAIGSSKIRYCTSYELFTASCCSGQCIASCCNPFPLFFISLAWSSQTRIFLYYIVACDVRFNWQLEPHKSDIIRLSYELFTAHCRSRGWMASCFNNFPIFLISLALSSQCGIFLYHTVPCDASFDWQLEVHKFDTLPWSYELFTVGSHSCRWMASC
jgi:hypothetical protein